MTTIFSSLRHPLLTASLGLSLLVAACGGDEFEGGSNAGAGGASGGSGQGASGTTTAGQGGAAGKGAGGSSGGGGQAPCTVGTQRCTGDNREVCVKGNKYEFLETCPSGKCVEEGGNSECDIECKTDEYRCKGDELQVCSAGGFVFSKQCDKGLCSETSKACLTCKEGEVRACSPSGKSQLACDEEGVPSIEKACPFTAQFCVGDGTCSECRNGLNTDCPDLGQECIINTCSDKNACTSVPIASGQPKNTTDPTGCDVSVCDGNGEIVAKFADAGTPCELDGQQGICTGTGFCAECVPDTTECLSSSSTRFCGPNGKWSEETKCSSDTPACSTGQCRGVSKICAGGAYNCALLQDGRVRCWGTASYGETGHGPSFNDDRAPTNISLDAKAVDVACGEQHACLVDDGGDIYCWGNNAFGQLGNGQTSGPNDASMPTKAMSNDKFVRVFSYLNHSCAITNQGKLHCWGSNGSKQIFQVGSVIKSPVPITLNGGASFTNIKSASVGAAHVCALQEGGKVYCWGDNSMWQHGNNSSPTSSFPNQIAVMSNIDSIYGWSNSQFAFLSTDPSGQDVWTWGELAGVKNAPNKVKVSLLFPFKKVVYVTGHGSSEGANFCAISGDDGSLFISGDNKNGVLGNGTKKPEINSYIHKITGVMGSAVGTAHVCAWTKAGKTLCWGANDDGQVGIGTDVEQLTPTEVKW